MIFLTEYPKESIKQNKQTKKKLVRINKRIQYGCKTQNQYKKTLLSLHTNNDTAEE